MDVIELNKLEYFKTKLLRSSEWSENFICRLNEDKMQLEIGFSDGYFNPLISLNSSLKLEINNFSKPLVEETIREITDIYFRLYRIKLNFEKD